MTTMRPHVANAGPESPVLKMKNPPLRRRCVLLCVSLAGLCSLIPFSGFILVASPLTMKPDFLLIADLSCGPCFRQAVTEWNDREIEGILLPAAEKKRLELMRAIPQRHELGRQKLLTDGVPPHAVSLTNGICRNDWDTARSIEVWLEQHPDKQVRLLCDRFSSRRWSFILDRCLTKSNRSRLSVNGVADPRFDESNWWRKRMGLKSYFHNLLRLGYAHIHGEDQLPLIDWDPEKYESIIVK